MHSQARVKQLKNESMEYILLLPATPVLLLQQHPAIALNVFSVANPPVSFPLNLAACNLVRSRMQMRGGGANVAQTFSAAQLQGQHPPSAPIHPSVYKR